MILLGAVLVLGRWMPQQGPRRKWYIAAMVLLHTLLCGLRHPHLTGDLMKYHWEFLSQSRAGWAIPARNPGFSLAMQGIYRVFDGNFQIFLFVTAAVSQLAAGWVIWKDSPAPWLSYLTLHCLGFFVFGFSAVKQALGMAFVLLAFRGIAENRPKFFFAMVALAGAVHLPMLAFLPAYFLTRFRVDRAVLAAYVLAGVLLFCCREPAAEAARQLYYGESDPLVWSGGPGGRFFLMVLITAAGLLLRGTENVQFGKVFHLMAVSCVLQLFSGFDHVFTRLADVYFQFSVLYLPAMVLEPGNGGLAMNRRSRKLLAVAAAVFLIWYYYETNLSVNIENSVDNYWNLRFFWQTR